MSEIRYQALSGEEMREHLPQLSTLRLSVFRDWPYLYQGTLDYEQQYLETYARCSQSLAVLAWDGPHCVGATTALPLRHAEAAMQSPFLAQTAVDVDDTLYFGESVVLASHRGRGIGVAFFEQREAHARALGLKCGVFCAVDRPVDHPLQPAAYTGNDRFWSNRGYIRHPEMQCRFDWQDVGENAPTAHTLTYWLKML